MVNKKNKRGISPVIATVLLIAIVVILGFIIFLWANSVIREDIQKFGEPIQNSCSDVELSASSLGNSLVLTNNGDRVPVYNVALHIDEGGDIVVEEYAGELNIAPGRSKTLDISGYGNVVAVSPVLKGTKGGSEESYVCDDKIELF
ncbi:MAG TPA: archaellin/type IV pilin N-terminal domain-containing protein [Candidatus Nanoarchaeia archaeon]|nr:archaellin/type IV pilin N-terminal domain-containing protein [Candidatus Nanoarchaeia archaeon]